MPTFTHFYIVTDAGTCIYSRSTDTQADQHLLPGFMMALESFAQKMLAGNLESVSIGKSRYFAVSEQKLLFIVRTELNVKENLIREELEELQRIFFSSYPAEKYSANWDAMRDIAPKLDAAYGGYFKDSDQKMREAVW
jgi:hypothetical protein